MIYWKSHLLRVSFFLLVLLVIGAISASANDVAAPAKSTFDGARLDHLDQKVRQARILIETGQNAIALTSLREAVNESWHILFELIGENVTANSQLPRQGLAGKAVRQAAEAHYWWGIAARDANLRDEAITAFARATTMAEGQPGQELLRLNIQTALGKMLANGFPLSAAPDVLGVLSDNAGALKSTVSDDQKSTFFFIPRLLPASSTLPRVAPLYRNIPAQELPRELESPYIAYGYSQPSDNGLATLQVKVRYKNAEQLALATKLARLMTEIKERNPSTLPLPPLTLWLEHVGANWPQEPDDNTPWEAAAKIDSAPYDVMIFRADKTRSDVEWFRELQHEYGHIAWPNFNHFTPPLEPNANGLLAEIVGMLHYAARRHDKTPDEEIIGHIERNAISPLQFWLAQGPRSPLATGNSADALRYLQGLTVYLDRVYNAFRASGILRSLSPSNNNAQSLLTALPEMLRARQHPFDLYLPAANLNTTPTPQELASALPVAYPSDSDQEFLLYIPQGTRQLRISWEGNGEIHIKSTFGKPVSGNQQILLETGNVSGWHQLRLAIRGNITLGHIQLEQ